MIFTSYIDLLNAVDKDGELIQPSGVSVNRSFATKELYNIQLDIQDFKPLLLSEAEADYYSKELQWYFDSYEKPKHEKIELTHDLWDQHPVIKPDTFAKDLKKLSKDLLGAENRCGENSNYGEMMLRLENHVGVTQFIWVTEKLKADLSTRQAVAFYNTPNYQYFSNNDFVCCLTQLFTVKGNKFNTVINCRSNDLINSFRFDSIWFRLFQKMVLDEVKKAHPDLTLGSMFFNIFSAHFYIKDAAKLADIRKAAADNSFIGLKEGMTYDRHV